MSVPVRHVSSVMVDRSYRKCYGETQCSFPVVQDGNLLRLGMCAKKQHFGEVFPMRRSRNTEFLTLPIWRMWGFI